MALFGNLIYGIVPTPELPIQTTFEVLKTDPAFMGGKATRKDVKIKFTNAKGSADMTLLVFTPNSAGKSVPAIPPLSFANTKDDAHDAHPEKPGVLRNGIPLGEILQKGFGYVVVSQGALVRHNEVEFQSGIHPLFYRTNQSFPKARRMSGGCLSAIAWSASRAMDYLETDHDIDAKRNASPSWDIPKWGRPPSGPPPRTNVSPSRFLRSPGVPERHSGNATTLKTGAGGGEVNRGEVEDSSLPGPV